MVLGPINRVDVSEMRYRAPMLPRKESHYWDEVRAALSECERGIHASDVRDLVKAIVLRRKLGSWDHSAVELVVRTEIANGSIRVLPAAKGAQYRLKLTYSLP